MSEDLSNPGNSPYTDADRLTAYHEAGHAVMAQLCGQQITEVEIVGDAEHAGSVQSLRFPLDEAEDDAPEAARGAIEDRVKCTLAGMVVEAMVSGHEGWDEGCEDLDLAVRLGMRLVEDCEDVVPLLEDIRIDVERDLRAHWSAVEMLAVELLHRKALTGSEMRKLLASSLT